MQGHDRGLDTASHNHQYEEKLQHPRRRHINAKESTGSKIHRARNAIHTDCACEEKLSGNKCVCQILPRSQKSFLVSLMEHQRIARNRQDFVKYKEGQQIRSHRETHRCADAKRERREVACLHAFVIVPHVANAVKIDWYPQKRSQCRENHTSRIDAHCQPNSVCKLEQRVFVSHAIQNAADHADDNAEHGDRTNSAPSFTDIRIFIAHGYE